MLFVKGALKTPLLGNLSMLTAYRRMYVYRVRVVAWKNLPAAAPARLQPLLEKGHRIAYLTQGIPMELTSRDQSVDERYLTA